MNRYILLFGAGILGYHRTMDFQLCKISEMTDAHLQNSIRFAERLHLDNPYWNLVVPQFKAELAKRLTKA